MIKCTECGLENMDGLDYCDGCGAKLAVAAPAPSAAATVVAGGVVAASTDPAESVPHEIHAETANGTAAAAVEPPPTVLEPEP
ncbi:MAG: hypothetical protein ABSG46_08460, partial [Candidatus Binataceae bacterium]